LFGDKDLSFVSEVYRTRVRRERIGFIFQAQYLIPQLTAIQNVALPKLCMDIPGSEAERMAIERLSALGMSHRLQFRVAELSGGEQQRVSIARSLMNSPEILIADEPSASIDEDLTAELLSALREMVDEQGLTVIVASHDPRVLGWADQRLNMRDGRIVM
jgi:putative ABC transport system ATP-binding protein